MRVCWSPHGPSWESQNSKWLLQNPQEKQRMQISPPHSRLRGCVPARLRSMGAARPRGWMKAGREYAAFPRVAAGSETRSSDCSLTSELQRLSADGDALPCAVSIILIHLTRDASVHASGNRKWIGVNHSAALLGVLVQTPDEGLSTQLLPLLTFWTQEALFKVISLVYLV